MKYQNSSRSYKIADARAIDNNDIQITKSLADRSLIFELNQEFKDC